MAFNSKLILQQNINAIKTMFQIEKEHRQATQKEKEIIRDYKGFGGLKFILNPATNDKDIEQWSRGDRRYFQQTKELHSILLQNAVDEKEYQQLVASMKSSVLTAFYTPSLIPEVMAQCFAQSGIVPRTLLDPSAGIGVFMQAFQEYNANMGLHAYEKDLLTGKMLALLYPEQKVWTAGFETMSRQQLGLYDMAASNIPFGDIRVFDPDFQKDKLKKKASNKIHDYFFIKALDAVRNGGIVAFITSQGVANTQDGDIRKDMMQKANLISAIRLPNDLFADEANTSVGSDLIILQKNNQKGELSMEEKYFITADRDINGVVDNMFFRTARPDRTIHTEGFLGTDPYGKPAWVYTHSGGVEGIAKDLREMLMTGIQQHLDKDLYFRKEKTIGEKKQEEEEKKQQRPQKPTQQAPVMSLFDLFGFSEEEKSVALTGKKGQDISRFNEAQGKPVTDTQKPSMEKRPYQGEIMEGYRGGIITTDQGQVGRLIENNDDELTFKPLELPTTQLRRLELYSSLRDTYMSLYAFEKTYEKPNSVLREKLNSLYDDFHSRYGALNDKKNVKVILMDAEGRNMLGIERVENGKYVKADIFEKPVSFSIDTVSHVDSAEEALAASLNRYGKVNLDYMKKISDFTEKQLVEQLKGKIYYAYPERNPEYETAEKFLSGNIYEKLEEAEKYANWQSQTLSEHQKEIEESIAALKATLPAPIPFEELDFNFGERWMPTRYMEDYMTRLYHTEVTIDYVNSIDEFKVDCRGWTPEIYNVYAIRGEFKFYDGREMLRHALLNTVPEIKKSGGTDEKGQTIRITDGEKMQRANAIIEEIRNGFTEYLNDLPIKEKEELADLYNRKFNCYVRAQYDGSCQTFPDLNIHGLKEKYNIDSIYQSQKDCVWMLKQNGGGICDHEVGTGKTLIMCMAAHEMKRLGMAHKPMIIGLKANVAAIADTYHTAYPNARILYASEKDFSKENRVAFFNNMKNNDYDCIIMSHDQFCKIPQSLEVARDIIYDELWNLTRDLNTFRENGGYVSGRMLKGLEKREENLKAKLLEAENAIRERTDDVVDFKMMGVDHIFIDESHQFKNLMFTTRHQRVAGLGNTKGSQKAMNLLMAIRTIQQKTERDLGATFLSGTTVTNSLSELYLLFKYLRPKELEKQQISNFDAWAAIFAKKSTDFEFNVANNIVQKERFRQYIKVPELATFYNEITDYRNAEMVGVDRPRKTEKMIDLEPTSDQEEYIERLKKFAETGDPIYIGRLQLTDSEEKAKMLIATDLARKMSLDMRLIDPAYEDDPGNKASVCAAKIAEYYQKYNAQKGTQMVFSDLSTYKPNEWNVYSEIKRKLVEDYGIPEKEVRFIQEATTEKAKEKMISQINAGEIRVVMGSTSMLGTGVNAQERVVAVHHLDTPWRPSDLEQRDGRAVRAGNIVAKEYANNNVDILIYGVKNSLDSYKFNLLHNKQVFIHQIKTGTMGARTIDEGAMDEANGMNYSEYMAILSGNPDLLEKAKMEKKIAVLESERKQFIKAMAETERSIHYKEEDVAKEKRIIGNLKIDMEKFKEVTEAGASIRLNGLQATDPERIGARLQKLAKENHQNGYEETIGSLGAFKLLMKTEGADNSILTQNRFYVQGIYSYSYNNGFIAMADKEKAAKNFLHALEKIPGLIVNHQENLEKGENTLAQLVPLREKKWNKEDALRQVKTEMEALERKLKAELTPTKEEEEDRVKDIELKVTKKRNGSYVFTIRKEGEYFPPQTITRRTAEKFQNGEMSKVQAIAMYFPEALETKEQNNSMKR